MPICTHLHAPTPIYIQACPHPHMATHCYLSPLMFVHGYSCHLHSSTTHHPCFLTSTHSNPLLHCQPKKSPVHIHQCLPMLTYVSHYLLKPDPSHQHPPTHFPSFLTLPTPGNNSSMPLTPTPVYIYSLTPSHTCQQSSTKLSPTSTYSCPLQPSFGIR